MTKENKMSKRKKMSPEQKKKRARELYIKRRDERYAEEAKQRAERRAYVEGIRNSLGKATVSKMYDNIDYEVLKAALDNAEWVLDTEFKSRGAETDFILSNYSRQSSIAGSMDYVDHRGDKIEDIRERVYKDIKHRLMQNCQYYNIENKIFDIVRVVFTYGAWSVEAAWSDKKDSYSSVA